jgi:hypothetical protein
VPVQTLSCQFGTIFTEPAAPHSLQIRRRPTADQGKSWGRGVQTDVDHALIALAAAGWVALLDQPFLNCQSVTSNQSRREIPVRVMRKRPSLIASTAAAFSLPILR